jgi:hypothetical protein
MHKTGSRFAERIVTIVEPPYPERSQRLNNLLSPWSASPKLY